MTKPTYEDKMNLLDSYIKLPRGVNDVPVLQAIKLDVVKASSKTVRKPVESTKDNALYNTCMGIYRDFLKSRDSHLDMTGKKARQNSDAMRGIITYIVSFTKSNGKPSDDEQVANGVRFMFKHWDSLNDFHRNRIKLPDIYNSIEEILPMIKNGYNKKTRDKNALNSFKHSLKGGQ